MKQTRLEPDKHRSKYLILWASLCVYTLGQILGPTRARPLVDDTLE